MTSPLARFPHVLAAALASGCAAALMLRLPSLVVLAAPALAVGATAVRAERRLPLLAAAVALLGWSWGSARLEALDASVLAAHVGEDARVRAVVTGPVRRGLYRLRMPALVERFGELEVRERVLLQLPVGRSPPQGARLELLGRLAPPRPAEGGFDERAWLRRQGVQVVLDGAPWRLVGRRGGIGGLGDRIRAHVARTLAPALAGERRALVAGVVLGADEGLSEERRDDFRASGLYHLLAVSGQNVGLLAGGVVFLAWLLGAGRWWGELAALAAIGGYVLAVGLQPSVVRAGVAGSLACLAWLAARPRDRWYFLLIGACVLLAWNPYNLLEPGFQLSFAAVAAIFVVVPRLDRGLEGYPLPRGLGAVVAVSVACGFATAPILWLHFHAVPLYTVPANALAAAAVAPILGLALLAAALEPLLPAAAAALVWCAGWPAAYVAACAHLVAGLPFAQLESGAALLMLAAVVAAALLVARLPRRRRWYAVTVAGSAAVLVAGCTLQLRSAPPRPIGLRVTVLDVGQGDGILLETSRHSVLVDQGPPEGEVARQLRDRGFHGLSLVVLTHPQRDHVGGAARVLRALRVRLALDPRLAVDGPEHREALAAARDRAVKVVTARAGQLIRLGALRLRVLWPSDEGGRAQDPNENAVVLLASYGSFDALLTADAESPVTLPLRPPPVELLKVAHHGSADSALPALLARTRPRAAVVSVGAHNDYGHPAPSTMAALAAAGVRTYRTDRDGAVTIETDGRTFAVRSER